MRMDVINTVSFTLNSSEAHIAYALWFYAPDFLSMVMFFVAALIATIQLMPLGKKA
ncbi:hypothetical protein [Pectobacterium versatile]|uniref:hypothetical protein n=1 Tax=Pectobacterium versatile TaxID=2488639 RepID=UPI000FA45F10|nr:MULTISPECIES: hypothetical protein [Pectobacterium]GKV83123.1 hypothetical protein PEC106664_38970 [Pectobacterium carotovorum subsp. carotovorum]MBQ4776973.1 hypothetical protein [Pectobacterium versatile]MBQ4789654.1 hypothetical protein [Pectobacterium versatile]RUR90754.1 hypothetical protein PB16LOC_03137 [Pectobacterium versatile]UEQ07648.1 hypothetical protein LLE50_12195 [Pectobacterium versatile]